jgi:ABC-type glycerol-3-phosphate transport system substrate-binding protein
MGRINKKNRDSEKSKFRKIIRYGTLILIIAVFAYMLIPSKKEQIEKPAATGVKKEKAKPANVKYVLKFAPSPSYLPGNRPWGTLPPLKGFLEVIKAYEKIFPDTRIEIVNAPLSVREYLVTQLSSGAAPDIVSVNVGNVWPDIYKNWYVPITKYLNEPNPFVVKEGNPNAPGYKHWWDMFKYQAISRRKIAPDGNYYSVGLDLVETGIYYNKDIFKKYNIKPPKTWDDFIKIMKIIKNKSKCKITPIIMPMEDNLRDWAQNIIFDQLYYSILPGIDVAKDRPDIEKYFKGHLYPAELAFLNKKGFFTKDDKRYIEMWKLLYELRQYTTKNLGPKGMDWNKEFITQRAAMYWTGCFYAGEMSVNHAIDFNWGIFYLPPMTKKTSKYADGHPAVVIGGEAAQMEITNSAVSDTNPKLPFKERIEKSERLKRAVAFLQFVCLPENTEKIVNEYAIFLPNIKGVEPLPSLAAFKDILKRRCATTGWNYSFDLKFANIQQRMLAMYLEDGISLDGFLDWQTENVRTSADVYINRNKPDMKGMEKEWEKLAPLRKNMIDLPALAKEGGTE